MPPTSAKDVAARRRAGGSSCKAAAWGHGQKLAQRSQPKADDKAIDLTEKDDGVGWRGGGVRLNEVLDKEVDGDRRPL